MAATLVRMCIGISSLRQNIKNVFRKDSLSLHTSKVLFLAGTQSRCYRITSVYLKRKSATQEKAEDDDLNISKKNKLPVINVWKNMTVKELAHAAQRSVDDVLLALSFTKDGTYFNENTVIESSTVLHDVVKKLGMKCIYSKKVEEKSNTKEIDDAIKRPPPDPSVLVKRHPVVTIMGHVDHGKTTLLDALRHTSVVDTEFGGITQHIGAFNVTLTTGERMTFLDTPGHAAFSAMRARGAQVTDIVVLVVAADDGVMEQTVQSIEMAQAANVPIVVAINKIDLPAANIERTQKMLAQRGILVEDLGGDVLSVNISALENINLDILMDTIATQAELLNLKGDPTGLVEAVVIECTNDIGRGKLATVLVQHGTLRKGAVLVSGTAWGKIRGMFDHSGAPVTEARLSEAVQTIGWRELPFAGEEVLQVENEQRAHTVVKYRKAQEAIIKAKEHKEAADERYREYLTEYKEHLSKKTRITRYRPMKGIPNSMKPKESNIPKVNVIIKGDVVGSVEAILDVLNSYSEDEKCCLSVAHYGVGNVTETDIELAETFNAIIYPFNVTTPKKLLDVIKEKRVLLRPYNVIYKLIDDIKEEIINKLPQITVEDVLGEASILQEFEITEKKKKVKVAGCRCTKGNLKKSALYRLIRNGDVIFTGKLASMRHLKSEVNTIKTDMECGLRFEDPTVSFQPGDTLICFLTRVERAQLQWNPGF